MDLSFNAVIVIGALLMEAGFGYPAGLFRRIRHPAVWMGALITALDKRLNAPSLPEARRRLNGVLALSHPYRRKLCHRGVRSRAWRCRCCRVSLRSWC